MRECAVLTEELFRQFKEKAATLGYGPSRAIIRLMRRFLARGLDDGRPEAASDQQPTPTSVAGIPTLQENPYSFLS